MIIGIGTDIVKIERVTPNIAKRILSKQEFALFEDFSSETRRIEFLAGRFAAKEALKKAFPDYRNFHDLSELVILPDESGKPNLVSPQYEEWKIHLSISHEKEYAIAFAVVEERTL